jgi:putative spermidine/putrescine transport system ATP-binding protein
VAGDLGDAPPGTEVVAMVRPERIALASGPGGANGLSATVEDVIYFGDHLRARCAIDGQAVATVKLPLGPRPPVGGAVNLHLPAEHLRIYR